MSPRGSRTLAVIVGAALMALVFGAQPVAAGAANAEVANTVPPSVTGTARYGEVLVADPGTWTPDGVTFTYRWLSDGVAVSGADSRRFRPRMADIGAQVSVEVTGSRDGSDPATAVSEPVGIRRGVIESLELPAVTGRARFEHVLTATAGTWDRKVDRVRFQWLRDGVVVRGATGRRHRLGVADFGHRMSVRVRVAKEGFRRAEAFSRPTRRVGHRIAVRHRVTYSVETRGTISADLATFKRQVQQTFDDPRGWASAGVSFRRVARGGDFTVVLAEASRVPAFHPICSSEWSCRVGRYVVINQTRWQHASPMWNAEKRSRRDYRHMVVNHETGHWLGHGHRSCPADGALAPVMQQQSKGLQGCRSNPWPTARERSAPAL